jgi:hypothetical protein
MMLCSERHMQWRLRGTNPLGVVFSCRIAGCFAESEEHSMPAPNAGSASTFLPGKMIDVLYTPVDIGEAACHIIIRTNHLWYILNFVFCVVAGMRWRTMCFQAKLNTVLLSGKSALRHTSTCSVQALSARWLSLSKPATVA